MNSIYTAVGLFSEKEDADRFIEDHPKFALVEHEVVIDYGDYHEEDEVQRTLYSATINLGDGEGAQIVRNEPRDVWVTEDDINKDPYWDVSESELYVESLDENRMDAVLFEKFGEYLATGTIKLHASQVEHERVCADFNMDDIDGGTGD
jgi:hypothetical protein